LGRITNGLNKARKKQEINHENLVGKPSREYNIGRVMLRIPKVSLAVRMSRVPRFPLSAHCWVPLQIPPA